MLIENKKIQKTCSFYVSDFHLEMILLPYINKKIEENKKIIIQSEKDLMNSLNVLISRINLTDENKKKILNFNWNRNDDIEIEENSDIIIIGSKEYIKEKKKEISKRDFSNVNIVDCYNFEEIKEEICIIEDEYDKMLNMLGNNNF